MTLTRLSYVDGDPDRIDDLIVFVKTVVKPATDQLAGNRGLGMWVNRNTGSALIATVWYDESSLFDSEAAVIKLRDDGAGIVGGSSRVERFQVAFTDMSMPNETGFVTRMMRLGCDPRTIDDNVKWAEENIATALRRVDGYSSFVISIDRSVGSVLSMTTYRDETAAAAGFTATAFARDSVAARGLQIQEMLEYEVAIVGIRETPMLPNQRTLDLTDATQPTPR